MIATILGVVAALLILASVALFVVWTVVGAERDAAELADELASRTRTGPIRVYPADDLTRISDAVTDTKGRAL